MASRQNLVIASLTILGAALGYAYWNQIGCLSGQCNITSVWYNSTAYGGIMGFLVSGIVNDSLKKKKNDNGKL